MRQQIVAFVLGHVPARKGELHASHAAQPKSSSKSGPHYYASTVPKQRLLERTGDFAIKTYEHGILLAEVRRGVDDVFSTEAFTLRERLVDECQMLLRERGASELFSEEYAIAVVSDYQGDPEQFFAYAPQMACFLKSEQTPLDENEVAHTLKSQLKYSQDDLVIVDWDGAFVFDPKGDIEPVVELFQVANLQLLQYRVLDSELDHRLRKVEQILKTEKPMKFFSVWNREVTKAFKQVISARAHSIVEFDALEREIRMIGDWYSARLFELASRKFKLENWKAVIKEKLDSIEDVYGIVSENFSVNKQHFLEMLQIILFFVLQVGWFALIILEFQYFTR